MRGESVSGNDEKATTLATVGCIETFQHIARLAR
jgi:hypothetical protein